MATENWTVLDSQYGTLALVAESDYAVLGLAGYDEERNPVKAVTRFSADQADALAAALTAAAARVREAAEVKA